MARPSGNLKYGGQFQGLQDILQQLTVEAWIDGLFEGTDRLTASGLKAHLDKLAVDYSQYDKSIDIYTRGHGNAKNVKDTGSGPLAIIENRDINPLDKENMNMDQTEEALIAYMKFIIQIKKAQGDEDEVGKFPKLKKL